MYPVARLPKLHVLFLCSMNRWRSRTAETLWRDCPHVEVRSRGLSPMARRLLSDNDLAWADLVLVMTQDQRTRLTQKFVAARRKAVRVLDIPDDYSLMDPELVRLLRDRAGPEIERALSQRHGR